VITKLLKKLGLTKQNSKIYLFLLENGYKTSKEIASEFKIFPNAVYRIIYKLDKLGLIQLSAKTPLSYKIISPKFALNNLIEKKKKELDKCKKIFNDPRYKPSRKVNPVDIEISADKIEFLKEATVMINSAKEEVLIISIGEPATSKELILADRRAIERGVKIKIIYHKYDETNREFIHNLIRNGLDIRHLKDWGYHMQIADGKKCLLSINNPKKTDERVNIRIQSKNLSQAFRSYFYQLWKRAEKIKLQ